MAWDKKRLNDEQEEISESPNSAEENIYVARVQEHKTESQGGVRQEAEDHWEDEYLCLKGDQWDTSYAPRDAEKKSQRPNITLNVCLPTIMNIVDALTASTPEADITGRERSDKEVALKLSDIVSFIFERNQFDKEWREIVMQGVHYGPIIGYVPWEADYMGGSGPSRWVGEVGTWCQSKDEVYFDPSIIDLSKNLQDCKYIQQRFRKSLEFIRDAWENGKHVQADGLEDTDIEEGVVPERCTVIREWHRGLPLFISAEDKKKYEEKAEEATDPYKKEMYQDMAKGELKGIHRGYTANGVFLGYEPYVYDDGLYPFAYGVLYKDEKNPYGYGEMRNIVPIQVAYNKCAEIEMESATVEGLGGGYFNKGSLSKKQHEELLKYSHRGGHWQEVLNKDGMEKRSGTQTPQSLVLFKEFLKTNIDTVTQNNAIQQGQSPGANVPYASIRELGARGDTRNKGKMNVLQSFMTQFVRLVINRIKQFYDDEREYRIRGNKSLAIKTLLFEGFQQLVELDDKKAQLTGLIQLFTTIKDMNPNAADEYGRFSNNELKRKWIRNEDEKGSPDYVPKEEEYMADFDIKAKIADERPTSRQYYESMAMQMFGKALGPKGFWETIETGKFPPVDEILQELQAMQQAEMQAANPNPAIKGNPEQNSQNALMKQQTSA